MVGHGPLEAGIGVRISIPQPVFSNKNMTNIEIKPCWVSSSESLPPFIDHIYSEDGKYKLAYRKYNSSFFPRGGSKVVCTREDIELESLWVPRGEAIGTKFKISIRCGMPNKDMEKFIYIDAICEEGTPSLQLLHYDSEGNLYASNIFTGLVNHCNAARAAGHYEKILLPEKIDFQATWNKFLDQVNNTEASIRFARPQLIPAI